MGAIEKSNLIAQFIKEVKEVVSVVPIQSNGVHMLRVRYRIKEEDVEGFWAYNPHNLTEEVFDVILNDIASHYNEKDNEG